MKNIFLGSLIFFGSLQPAVAQPTVDIGLFNDGNGTLEVRLRPDGPFDELVSSISFTIRWNDADGATLGAVSQVAPEMYYCPTSKSGPMHVSEGYRYQIFAGFSLTTLVDAETAWLGGEEIVLLQVAVNGGSTFAIVNDAWTADVNNNGNYYVSLNGEASTGSIYSILTGVEAVGVDAPAVSLLPNPTAGPTQLTVTVPVATDLSLELFDPTGRSLRKTGYSAFVGTFRETVNMEAFADGVYLLKVQAGDRISTHRLVVDHP